MSNSITSLERLELHNTNRPLDVIMHWRSKGILNLDATYQRGDVWGPVRRRNLIRSLLQGIPIPSIIVNDRGLAEWDDDHSYTVIDGKQRITSLLQFVTNGIAVPGEWFGLCGWIKFFDLPVAKQRHIRHCPLAFNEGRLKTIEEEKHVFELVNFGGVPQGQSDS